MTLSFSTKWPVRMQSCAGQPNYFLEKIWSGFHHKGMLGPLERIDYDQEHKERFGSYWDGWYTPDTTLPKLHTIRRGHRWKRGMKIHMVINNRTANRFQF